MSIDGMGCKKAIAEQIRDRGVSLKGNQARLHEDVEPFLGSAAEKGFGGVSHAYLETLEEGHGCVEVRHDWISEQYQWLDPKAAWSGLCSIGLVESKRQGYAAQSFATIWHIALNLLKNETRVKRGLQIKCQRAGWDHRYLANTKPDCPIFEAALN